MDHVIKSEDHAEYDTRSAGYLFTEISRELRLCFSDNDRKIADLVSLTMAVCLCPSRFDSEEGISYFGERKTCSALVKRLSRICEGLLNRSKCLVTDTTCVIRMFL